MTKQEIEQKQKDGAAFVLANPHLLCEELAERLGYTKKGLIGRLFIWRKNGLIPADFKKYNCRRDGTGKVNRSGQPLPESERAPRMGWKVRPPKTEPKNQPAPKPAKQRATPAKPLPKATVKPLVVGRAAHPPNKTGRVCSNGKAATFATTQNPSGIFIHNRDREQGKVLVRVDARTQKYVWPHEVDKYKSV